MKDEVATVKSCRQKYKDPGNKFRGTLQHPYGMLIYWTLSTSLGIGRLYKSYGGLDVLMKYDMDLTKIFTIILELNMWFRFIFIIISMIDIHNNL